MKSCFLAIAALALTATPAFAADITKISADDGKKFSVCMAMVREARMVDEGCSAVMKKMKVTETDMEKMRRCENNMTDAAHDTDCQAMMKKHPQLARGHGANMPDPNNK